MFVVFFSFFQLDKEKKLVPTTQKAQTILLICSSGLINGKRAQIQVGTGCDTF